MDNNLKIESALKMNKVVFEKIEFERLGFKDNDTKLDLNLQTEILQRQDSDIYKVTLILKGIKRDVYRLEIVLSGYFSFESNAKLGKNEKDMLISRNSVAILMPYLRSEVSILTAQPDVECVVLPVFNINNMFNQK